MDLEAIWHTHKQFILKVIGGAVVFLILLGVRSSIANDTTKIARTNASTESALKDKIGQLEGAEGLEKGRANALGGKLEPQLIKTLMWEPAQGYKLPESEKSPALFHESARSKAVADVVRHAARWNARIPRTAGELGLREEVDEALIPEALAQTDLVRRVVMKLLDAGVRTITSVDPEDAHYAQRQADGRFLRALPIRISFEGDTALLAKALAEFQVEGSFLEVLGCRLSRADSAAGTRLDIELSLQALAIVDEAPQGGSSRAKGSGATRKGGRKPVRRFGRER